LLFFIGLATKHVPVSENCCFYFFKQNFKPFITCRFRNVALCKKGMLKNKNLPLKSLSERQWQFLININKIIGRLKLFLQIIFVIQLSIFFSRWNWLKVKKKVTRNCISDQKLRNFCNCNHSITKHDFLKNLICSQVSNSSNMEKYHSKK
jgi:hypothetical protein